MSIDVMSVCPKCGTPVTSPASDWFVHGASEWCCKNGHAWPVSEAEREQARKLLSPIGLADAKPQAPIEKALELHGGKLSGDHYYRVQVAEPISPELQPYSAECADIIEALGMTFNEGEAFKAIWRLAAARQGRGKPGNKAAYDADKAAHYGARIAAQARKKEPTHG